MLAHGWLGLWARTLGKNRQLLVLRVRKRSETIGFLPLVYQPSDGRFPFSYRTLTFPGNSFDVGRDFILTRERDTIIPAIMRYLSRRVVCGGLHLSGIMDTSPNLDALQRHAAGPDATSALVEDSALYRIAIRGRGWEEYLKATSKSFVQKDIARLKNRYAEHSWRVREFGAESLQEELPTLTWLHSCSQARQHRGSIYHDPSYRHFLMAAAREKAFQRWVRVFMLEIDGSPAAFELGFSYRGIFYASNSGFEPRFASLSPSKFLMYQILATGFREGWSAYCFGPGAQDYKTHWGAQIHRLYSLRQSNGWGLRARLGQWLKPSPEAESTLEAEPPVHARHELASSP